MDPIRRILTIPQSFPLGACFAAFAGQAVPNGLSGLYRQFDGLANSTSEPTSRGFGRDFQPPYNSDGSISLSPLYPSPKSDLHVSTSTSLHQSFLWLRPAQA